MKFLIKNFIKKTIVVLSIIILLVFFSISPMAYAATKTEMKEGQFYYAGTTKGAYVVTEGLLATIVNWIGEMVDFLLGLFTMGGRMVFVGWTALLEEILTSALEATTGIPMEADMNSTQMDGIIKSSNNVTIEAIVYNKVPILDINLFKDKKKNCLSGTGHAIIKCDVCAEPDDKAGLCRMEECESCSTCISEKAELGIVDVNLITLIKDNVRMWYYVIRLIAMAGMLLVLLVVGIKMAVSTIAQDKALYKRMLVDWFVGMILIFTIHYMMIIMINLNETLVNVIKDVQSEVIDVTKKGLNVETRTHQELEIGIYEEVRSRAYDIKLINGTGGTILYISLVFMAIKYVFIYLKRYFGIIVLTLAAPGIGFSYAIQKVLSGKGMSFSKWLQEYFVTVIIQTVHALIYTAFVSMILIVSLNSISGLIIGLLILNYMADADKMFRKIFKMTGGSGSVADDAINNSNPKSLVNNAKSAAMMMAGNKLLQKSPLTQAVKAPAKALGTVAVLGAAKLKSRSDNKNSRSNKEKADNKSNELENVARSIQSLRGELAKLDKKNKENNKDTSYGKMTSGFSDFMKDFKDGDGIDAEGELQMEKELIELEKAAFEAANDPNASEDVKAVYEKIKVQREKFDEATNLSTADIFKAHISKFLDESNYYEQIAPGKEITEEDIKKEMDRSHGGYTRKTRPDGNGIETDEHYASRRNAAISSLKSKSKFKPKKKLKYGLLGKIEYDPMSGTFVRHSTTELIKEQLKAENLLGFSEQDKKLFKETTKFFKGTILGVGSLFVGLGTCVTEPKIGLPLLANGIASQINAANEAGLFDPDINYRKPYISEKNKRFKFNRFNKGAKQTIVKSALAAADGEKNKTVVQNVRKNHNKLYEALKIGGMGVAVVGSVAATPIVTPVIVTAGAISYGAGKIGKKFGRFTYSDKTLMGKIQKQHFKQLEERRKKFIQDDIELSSQVEKNEFEKTYAELIEAIENYAILSAASNADESITTESSVPEQPEQPEKQPEIILEPKVVVKKNEDLIIKEAVAEVVIKKAATEEITLQSFGNQADYEDIKKVIERKLISQGSLEVGQKLEIEKLEEKIRVAATAVLKIEEPKSEENIIPDGERKDQESHRVPKESKKEPSVLEQILIQESIKTLVDTKKVKSASEITPELVKEEMQNKRRQIVSKQQTSDVIGRLAGMKRNETGENQPIGVITKPYEKVFRDENNPSNVANQNTDELQDKNARVMSNKDGSRQANQSIDGGARVNNNTDASSAVNIFTDGSVSVDGSRDGSISALARRNPVLTESRVSKEGEAYISQVIDEIRTMNAPKAMPSKQQTQAERIAEKKKRISAVQAILEAEAKGSDMATIVTETDTSNQQNQNASSEDNQKSTKRVKTEQVPVDQIIQELFRNTEEREKIELLRNNINTMKKINRKGERMKMKTGDKQYQNAKKEAIKFKETTTVSTKPGDKIYQKSVPKGVVFEETYGPVTNIVELIRKNNGANIEQTSTGRRKK